MKKYFWLYIFLIVLFGDIAGILSGNDLLQYVCKPLLMPVLIGYFAIFVKLRNANLPRWILLALFFSWVGDVLLLFEDKAPMFFLLGLSAFLLAHVCYIFVFQNIRNREGIKLRPLLAVMVFGCYALFFYLLYPRLNDMRVHVMVYGCVICLMCMLALHLKFIKHHLAGKWLMAGALLFVISDAVLAINKFYQPFSAAGVVIMLTYGLAQLFIVNGSAVYLTKSE